MHEAIIVLEMVRRDGTMFVTAVHEPNAIRPTLKKHGSVRATACHWQRTGADATGYRHPKDRWELAKKESL